MPDIPAMLWPRHAHERGKTPRALLAPRFLSDKTVDVTEILTQDHAEIRSALSACTDASGPAGEAVRGLLRLCLPHFALEEKVLFPALVRLRDLLSSGSVHTAAQQQTLWHISDFSHQHKHFSRQHESIASLLATLLAIGQKQQEITDLVHIFTNHERIEDELRLLCASELRLLAARAGG